MKFGLLSRMLAGWALAQPSAALYSQLASPALQPIVGARLPALSADGNQIAFVHKGDIWVASSKGGRATPVTQNVEMDSYPVFSPDGRWIAFSSKRTGNWDIFVVPAEGGTAQQITFHAGNEIVSDWSPDGKALVFGSRRDSPNYALYSVDVATRRTHKLAEDYAMLSGGSFSSDNRWVAYQRYGFPWYRPRYQGSAAAQIWMTSLVNGLRHPLTTNNFQHLWARFLPKGNKVVTVTVGETTPTTTNMNATLPKVKDSPLRTPNLWVFNMDGEGEQLTTFKGDGVRAPGVARRTGDIAFEYDVDLWVLRSGKKKAARLELYAATDEKVSTRRRERLSADATEAESSPDSKTIAFGLRGDIWTIPVEKPKGVAGRNAEMARRLTDWAGDDSDFVWSADGKKLFFTSDRQFNTRLYELDVDTQQVKSLWNRAEDVAHPSLSPDGKQLGFWVSGAEGGLHVLDIETSETRRLVKVPGIQNVNGVFNWSPDMQYVAFARRDGSKAYNIFIIPAAGGEAVNMTHLNAHHSQPVWSPDGKYLFFQSNREGEGLYALPLTSESVRPIDTDLKFEKPKDPVKVTIDFQNAARRIRKVATQSPQADLTITPDGLILFLSEGDVWTVSYDGKETKKATSGGGKSSLRLMRDGRKITYLQGGEFHTNSPTGVSGGKVTFTAEWERDVRLERLASFTQFWRSFNRSFYDPNFHGRDWEAIRRHYETLLDSVETNDEFATLLQRMVGELDTSHSEVTAGAKGTPAVATPHLGFTFDYAYHGPAIRVDQVPFGSPADYEKTRIKPGEYILAINGKDVALDEHLYRLINDRQDREFELLVNDKPVRDGARKVRYRALTPEEWTDLNYKSRVDRLRKFVEGKSGGRTGYLHIPGMMLPQQAQFEREAYEYIAGKQAMIIDVRFNGGGNISDTLIDWLERKPHGYFRPRDDSPDPSPARAWDKPIIVLMNEHSYSNAEMFPSAMRTKGLARLVGWPTPGYVIWTHEFGLVDGTRARMPGTGVFRLDGTPQENRGEQPDFKVAMTPEDWLGGRDPQLDKALELLSK